MKKYILIQNDGEIETNSFELIGASTKRGESGKIGFFGSGLKYSIAYMMRQGIDFKVFSGEQELLFSTVPEQLKSQSFDRICINGKPTSYTVTMGPTWKEDWFVLREIYCNAIDEGSCTLVKETEIVQPSEGKTRVYIQLTDSLQGVVNEWDKYFIDERVPIFTAKDIYTCYLGTDDGTNGIQDVSVYHKTDGILYRRGVRVAKQTHRLYDYALTHVDINEDRTAKHQSALDYGFCDMACKMSDENWLVSILRTASNDLPCDEYNGICSFSGMVKVSDKWVDFSERYLLVVDEIAGRYAEEIANSKKEVLKLPSAFARKIKQDIPEIKILGLGSMIGGKFSEEVEQTPKMKFLLKEVINSLAEMKYEVPFDISVVNFEDVDTLGMADLKERKILIASQTFDMGRREIALVLMEESEHIRSHKGDETRSFQTHIFSQWLKTMENANGLFL